MQTDQGGACASCGDIVTPLCIDHNHSTGRVRALLCSRCNAAFGMLKESPERIEALLAYAHTQLAIDGEVLDGIPQRALPAAPAEIAQEGNLRSDQLSAPVEHDAAGSQTSVGLEQCEGTEKSVEGE